MLYEMREPTQVVNRNCCFPLILHPSNFKNIHQMSLSIVILTFESKYSANSASPFEQII